MKKALVAWQQLPMASSGASTTMSVQTSGLKRVASAASASSGSMSLQSALRAPKRWRTNEEGDAAMKEVSFGSLHETVVFDRTDSSSQFNTFRRVAVSDLSFGSSASFMNGVKPSGSFRWGEQRNATWSNMNPPTMPAHNARWSSAGVVGVPSASPGGSSMNFNTGSNTMLPQNNLLLRRAGLCGTLPTTTTATTTHPFDDPLGGPSHHSVRFPQRSASPGPLVSGMQMQVADPLTGPTATSTATVSRYDASTTLHHVSLTSCSENPMESSFLEASAPPRHPDRSASPMNILPEPIMTPATPCPVFQTPPKRPVRCRSPPAGAAAAAVPLPR